MHLLDYLVMSALFFILLRTWFRVSVKSLKRDIVQFFLWSSSYLVSEKEFLILLKKVVLAEQEGQERLLLFTQKMMFHICGM